MTQDATPSAPGGFPPPGLLAAAGAMRGFRAPWCVAGGWALDLFLGRATRPHGDLDLALFRDDQARLREHLAGWSFRKVAGGRVVDWPAGEWLLPPVHEVYASPPGGSAPELELLLNEREGGEWVFRRDPRVRCPADRVIVRAAAGLPVLCPAVVLLYKAKHLRPQDERDFAAARDGLGRARREWLRAALEQVHAGHPWLARL
jgi:hypothetical protein